MKKGTKLGLLGLVAAGIGATTGGIAALNNYLYSKLIVPQERDPDELDDNDFQSHGRLWARAGEGFSSATIQAVDGPILWAGIVPAPEETHRWAICLHGYRDTHESMGAIAQLYHQAGWNVLLPDQRGHGRSEGEHVGWGYAERLDLLGWVNLITRRDPDAQIVLHGTSMGGATVLMSTGGALPRQVKAAVSDCAYTSFEAEFLQLLKNSTVEYTHCSIPLPSAMIFSLLRRTTLRHAGYDLRDAAPIQAVAQSKTPTLFIHGVKDELIPGFMMGKLYQAARCPKSFLWMPEAGHARSVGTNPELYWAAVSTFLEAYIHQDEESFDDDFDPAFAYED